jgi:Na+/melibiose symporter-like transporter
MLAAYSSPYMPVGALIICLVVYLPNYYASHLGLDLTTAGWAFTVVRLFDIGFDPFAGAAMDGMRLRWGRYRPFLVLSSPLIAVAVYALFMAEPGVSANYLIAWLGVLYVGFSLCVLSQAAWGAALVPDYHERSRVYSRIQIFGVVGAVGALILPPILILGSAPARWAVFGRWAGSSSVRRPSPPSSPPSACPNRRNRQGANASAGATTVRCWCAIR